MSEGTLEAGINDLQLVPYNTQIQWVENEGEFYSRSDIIIDGKKAGETDLVYLPEEHQLLIEVVQIDEKFWNQGYGKRIYKMLSTTPLPDGSSPVDAGASFVSSRAMSEAALRVWESLRKEGKAIINKDGVYQFSYPDKPQDNQTAESLGDIALNKE